MHEFDIKMTCSRSGIITELSRLTGYDGYRILTISNQLGNFNHSYNRLQKIEKKLAFSKIFLHIFNQFLMAFGVSMLSLKDHLLKAVSRKS